MSCCPCICDYIHLHDCPIAQDAYPSRLECFLVFPTNFLFKAIWCVRSAAWIHPPASNALTNYPTDRNPQPSIHPSIHNPRACVKPFLDAKSRGSAFLLQSKAELLDFIAEEQLADFMGGGLPYEPKEEAEAEEAKDAGTA